MGQITGIFAPHFAIFLADNESYVDDPLCENEENTLNAAAAQVASFDDMTNFQDRHMLIKRDEALSKEWGLMRKHRLISVTGVMVLVISAVGIPGASAAPPPTDVSDATAVVSSIAPSLITDEVPVEVEITDPAAARNEKALPPEVSVEEASDLTTGIDFTIDYASGGMEQSGEFSVFPTQHDDVAAYVQGTPSGVRVLTAIASEDAPSEYSYTFDVPDGTVLVESEGGYRIQPPNEAPRGFIRPAWALDSAGNALETSYEWNDNVLTQTVDISNNSTVFPVLIDPAWGYGLNVSMGDTTSAAAWSLVHNCFNCYFPVDGAPASYPNQGDFLPLTVGWFGVGNFNCIMDVSYYAPELGIYGFRFMAAEGHIDGAGTSIDFQFISMEGLNIISIDAYVLNDFGALNDAYVIGATDTWTQFGANLDAAT